jgi:hypothetical protein
MPFDQDPPSVRREGNAAVLRLRASGCARYAIAAFLGIWLCGWAAGEYFAARAALMVVRQAFEEPNVLVTGAFAFLAIWLTLWTLGGLAALFTLVRMLAGRDEIRVSSDAWVISKAVGPFHRTRVVPVSAIRAILELRGNVILELDDRDVVVTSLPSAEERNWLLRQHRSARVGEDDPPRQWRVTPDAEGGVRVERRVGESLGCVLLLAGVAVIAGIPLLRSPGPLHEIELGSLAVALLFASLAIWNGFRREALLVAPGRLSREVRFLGMRRVIEFERESLTLTKTRDSDNDDRHELVARVNGKNRTLLSELNDGRSTSRLGHLLARHTGWTLRTPD